MAHRLSIPVFLGSSLQGAVGKLSIPNGQRVSYVVNLVRKNANARSIITSSGPQAPEDIFLQIHALEVCFLF
jgi:hypothetical protein